MHPDSELSSCGVQDDGYIAALLVEDGASNIDVNTPVAVMVEDKVRRRRRCPPPSGPFPSARAGAPSM